MKLFDDEIQKVISLLDTTNKKELSITQDVLEDVGKNNMIFSDEMAYELGGSTNETISFELPSSNYTSEDKLYLIGKDINELNEDTSFSRITLLKVKEEELQGEALYEQIEKIKLTKYRVSPKGYMLRTSTGDKEKVRISKELAKNGSFSQIGSMYINAYKQLPFVENVEIIFITDNTFQQELKKIAQERRSIIDTIDHILKGLMINDCDACSVKELCEKVEDLREIHESNRKQ